MIDYRKDVLQKAFKKGYDFINVFVKIVAQEIRLSPQEVREWALPDLTEMVADILTKNDIEAFSYYFPDA